MASQVLVATTATPVPRSITRSTPGIASAAEASKARISPPSRGHIRTVAKRIPGRRLSMPYSARPVTFSTMSSRGIDRPRYFHEDAGLSATRRGGSIPAASCASSA